jgi:hypothetical protein
MDELIAIRSFRSDVPERDPSARVAALATLQATIVAPAPDPVRPWWRARRTRLLAVAALVSVVVVTSAFGWPARVYDVIVGEPAPPRVKDAFALRNEGRERVLPIFRQNASSDTIVERAHGVLGIETSVGPVILWAAPTSGGGLCWIIEIVRLRSPGLSGCSPGPWRESVVFTSGIGRDRVGDAYLDLLHGRARPDVASVEILYADGESETVPVLEGFFLHEPREMPVTVVARDRAGAELARRAVSPIMSSGFPTPSGPERVLIRLQTSSGHELTFSIAPGADGHVCQFTRYGGTVSSGCGPDQRERVGPDELMIHPGLQNEAMDGKPLVTLNGVVGSAIARLELEYVDGTVVPVPVTERFVLFEIPPEHHQDERFVLVGRSKTGEIIARRVVS